MSRKKERTLSTSTLTMLKQEKERETGDIYDDKQRGEMLKADGITAAENAFMQGREMKPKKRKRRTHKDTVSVQLAEDEYKED